MSKKSELPCKCRLTMPRGGTRATFRAESVEDAQRRALRILKKKALPKGWNLTVDGPAGACYPKADPSAPRPFQVGDRVRLLIANDIRNAGETGEVYGIDGSAVLVKWDTFGSCRFTPDNPYAKFQVSAIALLEPAPQPKAEEDDIYSHPAMVAKDQEIATLKAEVERAQGALQEEFSYSAHERERAEAAERDARACAQERDAAQAKLDDIKALIRTWKILHKLDKPPESLSEAVAVVLDGAA